MQSTASYRPFVVRTFVLTGLTASLIAFVALPVGAQETAPTQDAARAPQAASRLAHPASETRRPNAALASRRSRSLTGGLTYDNGPINGNTSAWEFDSPYEVSNSFTMSVATHLSGIILGAWVIPGHTIDSAQIEISSEPNGGTIYYLSPSFAFYQIGCSLNQEGYNVCTEEGSFYSPELQPGTYWLTVSPETNSPVYWDQNSGVGCTSPGCPSQAYSNDFGAIPSESFTLLGDGGGPPPCIQSQRNLQIIHDFTQQEGLTRTGVSIDRAGNLYGTTANGGENDAGFAFRLTRFAGWLVDPLFNFAGGNNGGQPTGVIVGANGSLYGAAQGGIQNCGTDGSQYCGLVFNLRPRPTNCPASQCSWNETVPYRFTSESDGSGIINASAYDQQGNLYGTTSTGGTHDAGTVFELTPSGAGWTKTTLYSFSGSDDGYGPTQVLVGRDGNLYGVASGGQGGYGVVFQLTRSGGQWTENVIYTFSNPDGNPGYLVQDGAGNLYGIVDTFGDGTIFTLQKQGSGWGFSQYFIYNGTDFDQANNLAIDASGQLYGTGKGHNVDDFSFYDTYIFKLWYGSGGWNYQNILFLGFQDFSASGTLALDAVGNLYGTTYDCGASGYGTVWQLSP